MKRLVAGLLAGLMITSAPVTASVAMAASKKPFKMTQNAAGCGFYKGLAETVVGAARPGQFIYVKWMEITKQAPDPDSVNVGEPQLVGSDRYKPSPKGGMFVEYRDGGWYVFKQGLTNGYRLEYYNRGFLPDRFEVQVCVRDETTDPALLPVMVKY